MSSTDYYDSEYEADRAERRRADKVRAVREQMYAEAGEGKAVAVLPTGLGGIRDAIRYAETRVVEGRHTPVEDLLDGLDLIAEHAVERDGVTVLPMTPKLQTYLVGRFATPIGSAGGGARGEHLRSLAYNLHAAIKGASVR